MPYSIPGIRGASWHMFGFSGAITPENPNVCSIRLASSRCTADSRAVRGFPSVPPGPFAEAKADYIQLWSFVTLPGLPQTPRYIHAMVIPGGLDEEAAIAKAAARIDRQAILTGPGATRITCIIHESA